MHPTRLVVALGLALCLLAFAGQAQEKKPAAAPEKKPAAKPEEKLVALTINQLRERLSTLCDADLDQMPFRDAVAIFQERYGVTILVDTNAFASDLMLPEVETQPVKIPRVKGIKLEVVLRKLASQVQGVLLFRPGHLEITTPQRLLAEVGKGGTDPGVAAVPPSLRLPLVQADYEQRPLGEILKETAEWTGASIVLDPRIKEKGSVPLTLTLRNVPVDTAVRLLADMADLKLVQLDAVHYVTTKENAKTLQAEELKRRQQEELNPFMPATGQ